MKRFIIVIAGTYLILASIGCIPMAVASHELLNIIGIDSQIVTVPVTNTDSYAHCAISINNEVLEPRYLGLYHQQNIDYNIIDCYNSTEEFLIDYNLIPSIELIKIAIKERIQ